VYLHWTLKHTSLIIGWGSESSSGGLGGSDVSSGITVIGSIDGVVSVPRISLITWKLYVVISRSDALTLLFL
jgi:hypothetical protein